jgi:hypothetical protein
MEPDLYEKLRGEFERMVRSHNLLDGEVTITAKTLSPREAIGNPERDDFPLLKGKERLMQADFRGSRGQAFTDMYGSFRGRLCEILEMELANNYRRAVFIASLNAVMRGLNLAEGTVHCRDRGPEECARESARLAAARKIAVIGLQPALAEACSKQGELRILDLDPDNIGREKFGTVIQDGSRGEILQAAVDWGEIVLATGSSLVNGTFPGILRAASAGRKRVIFFGVSIAATAKILNLDRFCFRAE